MIDRTLPPCLSEDPRATRRNSHGVDPRGETVVYWMQRAQRAVDNPALDAAIDAANALAKPLVVFLGIVPWYPNGYASIAWAVGGRHDRPWAPRPVYGMVRCMTFASTSRKFDSRSYVAWTETLG